jgi:MFS family permease
MTSDRFDRFLPLAGALAGLVFVAGLLVLRNDPPSESDVAATFDYWADDTGKHRIVAMLLSPLMGFLLIFFAAGMKRRLERGRTDSGHGTVAFGGALLAAGTFFVVGMLEAAMTNAAEDGNRDAVYTLNQFHAYDWLAWNASFSALLLATALGALRNEMLPRWFSWVTLVLGAALLTPLGFFAFIALPLWLVLVGVWLTFKEPPVVVAQTEASPVLR